MKSLLSGAAIALALGPTAFAQGAGASAPDSDSYAIEELIVTAQRREERLQDVPASVSAFNSEQLEAAGVFNVRELTKITPGLLVGQSSYATQPIIRGVGSRSTASGDESQVAVYLDGVYQADLFALNLDLDNIERVEVLKGPQGTLFGRNATGGAINVITQQPSFEPELDLKATYGTFNFRKLSGRASGPITSNVAADLAFHMYKEDPYIQHLVYGRDVGGRDHADVQGSVLFKPTEATDITLRALYSNKVDRNDLITNAYKGNARAITNAPGAIIASKPNTTSSGPTIPYIKTWGEQYSIHAKHDFGVLTAEYTGARIKDKLKDQFDNDLTVNDFNKVPATFIGKSQVHDFLLSSNGDGRLQWIAGASYFHSKSDAKFIAFATNFNALNGVAGTGSTIISRTQTPISTFQDAESYSAFAEATYELMDRLFVTAGYRYTDETHEFIGTTGAVTNIGETSFTNGSPHVAVRFNITDDVNLYVTYAEGFKSGLYNGSANSIVPAKPETIEAYEAGVKATLTPTLQFNAAIYHYRYSNLQVQASPTNSTFLLTNAAQSEIDGFEGTVNWRATQDLTLIANLGFLDANYTDFPGAQGLFPNNTTSPPNGNIQSFADASGKRIIRSPKWTGNIGAFWDHPLRGGTLSLDGNVYFTSGFYWDVINIYRESGYVLVDAGATWRAPGDHLEFRVALQNLTDEEPAVANVISTTGNAARYLRPRSINFSVAYRY